MAPAGSAAARIEPVAVSRRPDHVDVFWLTGDGAIGSQWWNQAPGFGWGDHTAFRPAPAGAARSDSPVSAVGRQAEQLDVFWIGPDGAIASTWWHGGEGTNWGDHQPFPLTPPGAAGPGSGLVAVAREAEQLDVFWVGADGAVGSQWWRGAPRMSWADHQPFGVTGPGAARAGSPVAATARAADQLDVFWVGPDGAIGSTWWHAGQGTGWGDHQPFPVTPPGAAGDGSGLAVISRRPDWLDVFWVGPDGAIGSTFWGGIHGMGWGDHQPFAITGTDAAAPGSPVAVVARTSEHLDVFWVSRQGEVMSTWWDAAPGQGWGDHRPFAVTDAPGSAGTLHVEGRLDQVDLTRGPAIGRLASDR